MDDQSIARVVLDGVHLGHVLLVDPGADVADLFEPIALLIVEIVGPQRAVAVGADHVFVLVAIEAGNEDFVALQVAFEPFLDAGAFFVQKVEMIFGGIVCLKSTNVNLCPGICVPIG